MAKLIYALNMSVDGYTEDEHGRFGWVADADEELHIDVCQLVSVFGTFLYGRKMYSKMVYWETSHTISGQRQYLLDFARQWQAADKIVYSKTLAEPRSERTKIERSFDPDATGGSRRMPNSTLLCRVLSSPRKRSLQVLSTNS